MQSDKTYMYYGVSETTSSRMSAEVSVREKPLQYKFLSNMVSLLNFIYSIYSS